MIDLKTSNYKGKINGIKFQIKDVNTIQIWKPEDIEFCDFKPKCDCVVRYLIDEGFFAKKKCKVEVIS